MKRYLLIFAAFGWPAFFWAQQAVAQDSVVTKSAAKPVVGSIEAESPKGIKLKGVALIPAADVVDVTYRLSSGLKIDFYNPAIKAEKEIGKAALKKAVLTNTIEAYKALLPKLTETGHESLRCHVEYKIASYTAARAMESGIGMDAAIDLLKKFRASNPKSWQIVRASSLLAQLLIDDKKYDDAEALYTDLAGQTYLTDADRDGFRLAAAKVPMRSSNFAAALDKLRAVAEQLTDPKQKTRAKVYQAECLAQLGKSAEAREMLKTLLADPALEKDLRASAHNALGYCYYAKKQYKDALWEFLRVDVLYHQNREEHARALFFLVDLFDKLKEADFAKECRERLQSKQFAGTEYQARLK